MTRPLTILWKLSKKSLKFLCNLNSLAIKYILDTYCVYFTARDFSLFFAYSSRLFEDIFRHFFMKFELGQRKVGTIDKIHGNDNL